jgi:hypothetical protein
MLKKTKVAKCCNRPPALCRALSRLAANAVAVASFLIKQRVISERRL